ncbi:MAG: hypothetical protein KF787_13835 [Phycisphaeraceae bacterium]|nr:hypothetical protein [Phycisphaerae bacterium]MBX3393716.1 hypothetical protein [Phycisphaeraceae bacterium]HRJ49575.1 hypothetical protein [Phycisphaerales bacterium]
MLPEELLKEKAFKDAAERLTATFTKAQLTCEQGPFRTEWDPILRRHVFHSTVTAWRDFDDIEFIVSPEGRVVLFRDANRLEPKGPADPPLTSADLLAIAATTGEVGPAARIETLPPPGPLMTFTLRQAQAGLPSRIRFVVNASLRQVAAMEVLPAPPLDQLPDLPGMPDMPGVPDGPSLPDLPGTPSPGGAIKPPKVDLPAPKIPKVSAPSIKPPQVKFP